MLRSQAELLTYNFSFQFENDDSGKREIRGTIIKGVSGTGNREIKVLRHLKVMHEHAHS